MKRYPLILAALAITTLLISLLPAGRNALAAPSRLAAPYAFPGAAGFGGNTPGGRGGKVIYVTNLNDSGTGSLREALFASGPRTILFKVAGTINLQSNLAIKQPFVTLAGQTAPGQGVQIKGGMLKIATHDVIIRYLKIREGNPNGSNPADTDSISLAGNELEVYNIIIDNSTLIWGTDIGGMSILSNSHDVTIQDTILGEGLYRSNHPEVPHSYSLNLTQLDDSGYPTRITLFRNLITSSNGRNPQFQQPASVDMVNNVLYNWGARASYGNPKSLNLVNNYYVGGPLIRSTYFWDLDTNPTYPTQNNNAVFESGNVAVGFTGSRGGPGSVYSASPRFTSSIANPHSAQEAYQYVVANVGATRPVRDIVDQRIIDNLTNRTMRLPNGDTNRFINAADLVWPTLAGGTIPADSDNDGMADGWEQQFFGNTNRGSSSSPSSDADGDGYTDLEEYLNNTNPMDGMVIPPTRTPTIQPTQAPTLIKPTEPPLQAPNQNYLPNILAFIPSDDATVEKERPKTNQGSTSTLLVDNSPDMDFYLKFAVSGTNGRKVTKAVVRLYALDASNLGGRIRYVPSNDWNEETITWNNRPESAGEVISSFAVVSTGSWFEKAVTPVITGDGTYSFRIASNSSDGADYSSKEGTTPPQLIITLAP